MATPSRLTFLIDVDNTLIDNDAAKDDMATGLRRLLGEEETARFWALYETARHEVGMVNIPLTLARFERREDLDAPAAQDDAAVRERRFALADLLMAFPYERYLFPGALETIAHLRRMGRVAILSDGDPAFQPSKIWRAGIDAAVDGYVLVYDHKEQHLDEVAAAFPADHYVLVEDKPTVIQRVRERLPLPLTTVLLRQGHYAAEVAAGPWPGAHLTRDAIADLRALDAAAFVQAGTTAAVSPGS